MPGEYDDTLKRLINENKQDFADWAMRGKHVRVIANSRRATEFKRTIIADAIIEVEINRHRALLHFEFQVENDEDVPVRVLEYHMQARREYKLPVYSTVIYLKKNGQVPQSPLNWPFPEEEDVLSFRYKVIELAEMSADELRALNLPGLLPLMVLTEDGATHDVIEEIIAGLEAAHRQNSMVTARMLASLAFKKAGEAEQDWIIRRFGQMRDRLRDTPAYQEILEEGREEGRQEVVQDLREILVNVVQMRFPEIVALAKKQGSAINDPKRLRQLINRMFSSPTLEQAVEDLLDVPETDEKAS
ncbi:MAG TPA: hypothetical protein VFQ30_11120 [Ktedonobacteraceae bacterium]|nr:hypothetical protein [Ktedonobacteraceae bacterium]